MTAESTTDSDLADHDGEAIPATTNRVIGLDVLRVVAILGVVAIHVFGGIVSNTSAHGSVVWWIATAIDLGNGWVIPVFVMVSGALLLSPTAHEDGPAAFYRKRLLRLGPAFVAWQVFYIFVVEIGLSHVHLGVGAIAQSVANGTTYTHLYFLWLIVGLYLVAPVLAAFLNAGGERRAIVFAAVVLGGTLAVYVLTQLSALHHDPQPVILNALTQWVPYVGYFLAGWALRTVILKRQWLIVCAIVTLALLAFTIWEYGYSANLPVLRALASISYLGVGVAIASIGVFVVGRSVFVSVRSDGRAGRIIARLSAASFGVFLVHFFFLVLGDKLFPAAAEQRSTNLLVAAGYWGAIVVVSFAVSLVALRIPVLRRFF